MIFCLQRCLFGCVCLLCVCLPLRSWHLFRTQEDPGLWPVSWGADSERNGQVSRHCVGLQMPLVFFALRSTMSSSQPQWASLVAQMVKSLPARQREAQVRSLGGEDPLEQGMATHSSLLAWEIPWTEEPGGLQSTGSLQRVGYHWVTKTFTFQATIKCIMGVSSLPRHISCHLNKTIIVPEATELCMGLCCSVACLKSLKVVSRVQLFATPWTVQWSMNTGVGSRSLLREIFPTPGSNPGLKRYLSFLQGKIVSQATLPADLPFQASGSAGWNVPSSLSPPLPLLPTTGSWAGTSGHSRGSEPALLWAWKHAFSGSQFSHARVPENGR